MKYKVIVDRGVTIGGQRFPHGATIDTDQIEYVPPELPHMMRQTANPDTSPEDLKLQHDAWHKEQKEGWDAQVKAEVEALGKTKGVEIEPATESSPAAGSSPVTAPIKSGKSTPDAGAGEGVK